MGFSRQECWSGLPCPPPGDLPNPGIAPMSLASPGLAGGFLTTGATWEALDPHTLWPKHQNIKQKQYCNGSIKDFKNGPHQKKKKS